MRVGLVSTHPNGSADQVMQDLRTGLARVRPDWDVQLIRYMSEPLEDADSYDLIHLSYYGWSVLEQVEFNCPLTANVWHLSPGKLESYHRPLLVKTPFARLVVDDVGTLQMLGQMGYTNVVPVPMAFDRDRFPPLPAPLEERPFTVGCFGENFPMKRFKIVQSAVREAKVVGYLMVLPLNRTVSVLEPIEDVYSQIDVLVHSSFIDTSSRPGMEALACGVPVISTINEGMRRISNGGNITWYDGSVKDLVRAIGVVAEKAAWHREAAVYTDFPGLDMIALKYATMFEEVLVEQE